MAMTSLFGPTPAQIEEARRLQSRQEIAQEAEPFGVFAPLYAASRNLTRTAGQSLVSGLFPESQDPALREAQAVEQIRQKYMGQNMTDPSVLQQMAVELGPVAPMAALRLAETAKQLAPERIAPLNVAPGATIFDPVTNKVIFQAPDREREGKLANRLVELDTKLATEGLTAAEQAEKNALERVVRIQSPKGVTVDARQTQAKEVSKNKADLSAKLETDAVGADSQLANATAIGSVIDRSFTGFGADAVLKVGQIADALGVTVSGTTESEQLQQLLSKLAQGQARTLPGSLSEKELMFLREAIGTRGVTKETLRNVVKRIQQDAYTTVIANNKLQAYQSEGKDLNKFDFAKNTREARKLANLIEKASPEQRQQILGY
jgi:hypothetical protein